MILMLLSMYFAGSGKTISDNSKQVVFQKSSQNSRELKQTRVKDVAPSTWKQCRIRKRRDARNI